MRDQDIGSFAAGPMAALAALAIAAAALASGARADEHPVVVELFTSQGCSSCPPADDLLGQLSERQDVIALALHVDYWDYIGWKDSFARPEHTLRQKAYAAASGQRMIYTPQMIIGGIDHVVGARTMEVMTALEEHQEAGYATHVEATREGDMLKVRAAPTEGDLGPLAVQLVRYRPEETVRILRGENAGRTFDYNNIVTAWDTVATWDGRRPLEMRLPLEGDQAAVVLVQKDGGHGAIVGAAEAR
jgi:hypothetical protein